jgi:hypothetical protein
LLDRVDPQGTIPSQFFAPERVTSLEHLTGATVTFGQISRMLRHGFVQQPMLEVVDQGLDETEQRAIASRPEHSSFAAWLQSRPLRTDLPFQATSTTQLGVLQVRFALTPERTLSEIRLSGDFIANPMAVAALEQGLRGCSLERETLWRVVDQTFLPPEHYLLGVGPLETVVNTLLKGVTSGAAG